MDIRVSRNDRQAGARTEVANLLEPGARDDLAHHLGGEPVGRGAP